MTLWCMWYDANMQIVRIKNQWNRRKRFVECAAINCNFSHIKSKTKNWKKYLLDEMKYVVYTSDAFTELLYWSFDLFFFSPVALYGCFFFSSLCQTLVFALLHHGNANIYCFLSIFFVSFCSMVFVHSYTTQCK